MMPRRMLKFQDLGYTRICSNPGISSAIKAKEDKANSHSRREKLITLYSYSTDYGRHTRNKIILDPLVIN